ncbi:MAG: hypothetical protein JWR33_433 [Naasia sp.]|jgi:D-alanyl-D-alanine carboxypeptidase (penicillin-binding protein 5/6)|uniref:hypothetical protein n=1 Tax=Naasia sp. TaxID=2546198 RepID=UPI0026042157|nr:hypothetical protein [Naasia sp.]MCU1569692.1 hypothetical protein [Naasia sp.]
MAEGRERNRVLVATVAVLLVGAAVYTPAALLAPLPRVAAAPVEVRPPTAGDASAPALPDAGASGITLSALADPIPGGSADAVPIAAAAKLVTALVVLDARPVEQGRSGPSVPVTAEDYASYARYSAEGTRAVRVVAGDTWTEREALHALLIASSNNHAEMLARWAFGSLDAYVAAANAWLHEHGLTHTVVTDSTGLSADSVGTGADLARLAALAMTDPFVAEAVPLDAATTTRGTDFDSTIQYRPGDGITGISRSYTDEAGVCLLFSIATTAGADDVPLYGAILGEPSYADLDADVDALLASIEGSVARLDVLSAGTPVARYTSAWGGVADAVTVAPVTEIGWARAAAGAPTPAVDTVPIATARKGAAVGTASLSPQLSTALVLDRALTDPGPLWRLGHPGVVIPQFVRWVSGG